MTEDDRVDTTRTPEEDIAAFLDGRLPPAERQRVLDRAADDPDSYALLAEASATLTDLDARGSAPSDRPTVRPRRRWFAGGAVGLAAAAAVAILLFGPFGGGAADSGRLLELAATVAAEGLPGGAGDLAHTPWETFRGPADGAEDARLTRAGARLVDLAVAVDADDPAAGAVIARDVATILDGVLGAGPVVASFRDAAAGAQAADPDWAGGAGQAMASAVRVFDSPPLRLGLWLETVRLAALAADAELLTSPDLAAAGRGIAGESPESFAAEVRRVVDTLEGTRPEPARLLRLVNALLGTGEQP